MCIGIVRKLGRRMQSENSEQSSQSTNRDTVRNQVATMLIVNNVAFFLLLGPLHVHNIISIIEEHLGYHLISNYQSYTFHNIGKVITVSNSAINPIIYSAVNRRYREAFTRCFGCRKDQSRFSEWALHERFRCPDRVIRFLTPHLKYVQSNIGSLPSNVCYMFSLYG